MLLQQNFTKRRHQKWFACKPGKCTLDQIYGHPLIYNGFGHCKKNIFKICYHNIFSFVKST